MTDVDNIRAQILTDLGGIKGDLGEIKGGVKSNEKRLDNLIKGVFDGPTSISGKIIATEHDICAVERSISWIWGAIAGFGGVSAVAYLLVKFVL